MGWRAKSREVLQINDFKKLEKMLVEEKAEMMKMESHFGRRRGGDMRVKASVSDFKKTRKNIARIKTRMSQLKQMELRKNGR